MGELAERLMRSNQQGAELTVYEPQATLSVLELPGRDQAGIMTCFYI